MDLGFGVFLFLFLSFVTEALSRVFPRIQHPQIREEPAFNKSYVPRSKIIKEFKLRLPEGELIHG